jgi:hypothetical protein
VFSGGLIPVTGRPGMEQASWLLPARWGFAASAATVDLRAIAPFAPAGEQLWTHSWRWWLFSMVVLLVLGAAVIAFVGYRLRLRRCEKAVRLTSVQDRIPRHAHVMGPTHRPPPSSRSILLTKLARRPQ